MNVNYRENSIDPIVLKVLAVTDTVGLDIMQLCFDANFLETEEQYESWVSDWKSTYNSLSEDISNLKRQRSIASSFHQTAISCAAKLANTMLNARQYARDQRKIRRDAEFAQQQSKQAELV